MDLGSLYFNKFNFILIISSLIPVSYYADYEVNRTAQWKVLCLK